MKRTIKDGVIRFADWVVNLNALDEEISKYIYKNKRNPYLFMNDDSVEAFWDDFDKEKYPYIEVDPNLLDPEDDDDKYDKHGFLVESYGTVGKYRGCTVYINQKLDYGEVEIR